MTRRLITIKWLFYSLWTLLFLLVQQLVLPYIRIWGVHPFLLPALAAVAASFEGRWDGPIYGLVLGLICDLLFPGAFPCFYAITLLLSAVAAARMAGFENLSLDLIYGLPGQTLDHWLDTLAEVLVLNPEHISCYGLKLEEGTPLYLRRAQETFPDDDQQAEMYLCAVELLAQHGYEQYEISNFARPVFASRHNLKYWHMQEYAGFGPGAHSDMGGVRFAYERDLDAYIAGDLRLSEMEEIPPLDRDLEYIMLSLRTTQGIDSGYFERQFRQKFQPMEDLLVQYEAHGFAARTEKGWRLTPRGFFVSNTIIVSLQEAVGRARQQKLQRAAEGDFKIDV